MTAQRLILDSVNATQNSSGLYTFIFNNPITITKYLKLLSCQMPNVHYNFENNINNWLDVGVLINGGSAIAVRSFQISPGNYGISDLVTQLQNGFTSLGLTWTVSYSDFTSLLTIALTGGQFQLLFSSGPNASKSCWQQLGFQQNVDTALTSSLTAPNTVNVLSPSFVIIDIDNINPTGLNMSKSYFSSDFSMIFELDKGNIETYDINSNYEQKITFNVPEVLNQFDIGLFCHIGNLPGVNHPFQTLGFNFILLFEYL